MTSDATRRQIAAASPETSTWVSANAGSGKTRVLTNRVARLLLTGCRPERVLCLTFTKAAAAEMQGRLFSTLGQWAMLPDEALRETLEGIGETGLTGDKLTTARTLFAAALETPGGLKIQTIHAFCANLLRRFPVEAGVPPRFSEIDDRGAALLRAEIIDAMGRDETAQSFAAMAAELSSDAKLDSLLMDILQHRKAFERYTPQAMQAALGIGEETLATSNAATLSKIDIGALKDVIHLMASQGGKNDKKYSKPLHDLFFGTAATDILPAIEKAMLTDGNARSLKAYPSKALGAHQDDIRETFEDLQEIILAWRQRTAAIGMRDRCAALAPFAADFLERYDTAKASAGLVDFDDLIDLADRLLAQPDVGPWVLYKLDGGIDHILVDEAQDTSPRQWRVIAALEAEFTAGDTAVNRPRTLFVVGDKKQSIFSFQGADPEEFDRRRNFFAERLAAVERPFSGTELVTSFRSAAPILELVDRTFADDAETGALGGAPTHVALPDSAGRVDLWPYVVSERAAAAKSDAQDDGDGDPKGLDKIIDELSKPDPVGDLARDLASYIADIIDTETIPTKDGPRTVGPGDILVLVRSRSAFFHQLIDGLKANRVPVAGADRLRIGEDIAVKDLLSTLKFLAATYDDLSLAEALRSPLFGLSEDALFRLAHGRPKGQTLFQAMIESEAQPAVLEKLRALLKRTDFDRPYEILETLLMELGGRKRLTARLGSECEDAIDELLAAALSYEQSDTPSLTGFLAWMEARDAVVKRDMEAGRGEVRVMTVHGAKGLEAPVVILPDVSRPDFSRQGEVVEIGGLPFWNVRKALKPVVLAEDEAARQEDERREHARLLYVALTRAESWLILCGAGAGSASGAGKDRWHSRVEATFDAMDSQPLTLGERTIARIQSANWPSSAVGATSAPAPLDTSRPAWADQRASPAAPRPKAKTPSKLPGAHALPGEMTGPDAGQAYSEEEAKARGNLIHELLDTLPRYPAAARPEAARAMLPEGHHFEGADAEALALLDDPALAEIFAPDTLVEAPFAVTLNGQRWEGRMDRLIVRPDHITVIDFKSNRLVPASPDAVPSALLAQMGAYVAALEAIFEGRTVSAEILWTRTARRMALDYDAVSQAFRDAPAP